MRSIMINLKENYRNYQLTAMPQKTAKGKWSVAVLIKKSHIQSRVSETFYADDGIEYILEVEAAKECLNLGRRMIDLGQI